LANWPSGSLGSSNLIHGADSPRSDRPADMHQFLAIPIGYQRIECK